jgi:hypothetical protein
LVTRTLIDTCCPGETRVEENTGIFRLKIAGDKGGVTIMETPGSWGSLVGGTILGDGLIIFLIVFRCAHYRVLAGFGQLRR